MGKGFWRMNWRALLAGPLVAVAVATSASADVRVTNDSGGEITSYLRLFSELRASGERLVIDGPCLSACTLFTAFIPRSRVCVTQRAVLGFHAASYYDDASGSFVPTTRGTWLVLRVYPPEIRNWILRHGGLTPHILAMRSRDLAALYRTCE